MRKEQSQLEAMLGRSTARGWRDDLEDDDLDLVVDVWSSSRSVALDALVDAVLEDERLDDALDLVSTVSRSF